MSKKEERRGRHRNALCNFVKMCVYACVRSRIRIKWTSANKREWTACLNVNIRDIVRTLIKIVHSCLITLALNPGWHVRKDERARITWTSEWSANGNRLKPDPDRANEHKRMRVNNLFQQTRRQEWPFVFQKQVIYSFTLVYSQLCFRFYMWASVVVEKQRVYNVTYTQR